MSALNHFITRYSLVNALGVGVNASLRALLAGESGLQQDRFPGVSFDTWLGQVKDVDHHPVCTELSDFDCRNNRLAQMALLADGFQSAIESAKQTYASDRIGVFIGTSTSGVQATEQAYAMRDHDDDALAPDYHYATTQNIYSVANFTRRFLKLSGPSFVISTACSSSAKVFATASRYLQMGIIDAAVVGGVDSLCLTTLLGFNSLELVSTDLCRPWNVDRNGINIGEAAGFALLETHARDSDSIELLGYGESSDAYHISTPHPQGRGASQAMLAALSMAKLQANNIDYINLHGTATPSNDQAEDAAVVSVFGKTTPCSSSKGWTGHTLGAAGIAEAIFCFLALTEGFIPQSLNTQSVDPKLSANVILETQQANLTTCMSNSFGFGGSNCSLIFGKPQ